MYDISCKFRVSPNTENRENSGNFFSTLGIGENSGKFYMSELPKDIFDWYSFQNYFPSDCFETFFLHVLDLMDSENAIIFIVLFTFIQFSSKNMLSLY